MATAEAFALLVHDTELSSFVTGVDNIAVHLTNIAITAERHGRIKLLAYDFERQRDTLTAKRLHAVKKGTADEHRACTKRDRLKHVLARTDTAVQENLHAVSDSPDD